MKIKDNFILRQVADTWVVLPIGQEAVDFNGMLNLNETGAMLWDCLKNDMTCEELAAELTKEYNTTYQQALTDVKEFVQTLLRLGCVEE